MTTSLNKISSISKLTNLIQPVNTQLTNKLTLIEKSYGHEAIDGQKATDEQKDKVLKFYKKQVLDGNDQTEFKKVIDEIISKVTETRNDPSYFALISTNDCLYNLCTELENYANPTTDNTISETAKSIKTYIDKDDTPDRKYQSNHIWDLSTPTSSDSSEVNKIATGLITTVLTAAVNSSSPDNLTKNLKAMQLIYGSKNDNKNQIDELIGFWSDINSDVIPQEAHILIRMILILQVLCENAKIGMNEEKDKKNLENKKIAAAEKEKEMQRESEKIKRKNAAKEEEIKVKKADALANTNKKHANVVGGNRKCKTKRYHHIRIRNRRTRRTNKTRKFKHKPRHRQTHRR